MNLEAVEGRLIAKRLEPLERIGIIIIPEEYRERSMLAIVISVGRGRLLESGDREVFDYKPSDTILVNMYAGTEVIIDEEEFLVLRHDDVVGLVAD